MMFEPRSRRAFLAQAPVVVAALLTRRDLLARPHRCEQGAARAEPHPTPRPGITAARVVPDGRLHEPSRSALAAFDAARRLPAILDGIRCHCGCATLDGFYSLLSCYEGDAMAQHCEICQGQARMALRLQRAGRTLDQIRAAIDERYD